jgi:hypothetical protein
MKNTHTDAQTHNSILGTIKIFLLADITLVVLYILDNLLSHPFEILTRLVDLDEEANLPAWYSSSQILVLGLLLGLFAFIMRDRRPSPLLPAGALSLICLALSLDETAQIHEWIGNQSDKLMATGTRKGSLFGHTGIWMFILGPLFLIAITVLWRRLSPYLRGRGRVVRLYLLGFFVYVVSALGVEILANFVSPDQADSVVQIVCEEFGEMLGVTLLIWATLELITSYDIHIQVGDHRII